MAKKNVSKRQSRKMRMQQIVFGVIAFIIIASFIVSLIA
jgi:hypothetical protein